MADKITHELKTCAQYVAIAVIAGIAAFLTSLPSGGQGGDMAIAVNIREAWTNYAPVLRSWLSVFVFLSAVRLGVFYLVQKHKN